MCRSISIVATAAPEIPVLARDQAFESMYRCYVKDVYRYALALLRNPADAEDVTQTTFLNAYRAYQSGIEIEKPQNWLIKIAHNVARTRYARAGRRVKEVPLEDHVEQLAGPDTDRPDVTGVLRALGRLPFNQRAALVMRELEGRSYAEIADTIGVSVSAVETLIFRGRKSLRLRASSLRSLAAVPLPTSLTRLFDGGGVVAGGGATAGTGLLVKAAVAIVAAALGTGVGGDHSPVAAAVHPSSGFGLTSPGRGAEDGLKSQLVGTAGVRAGDGAASKGSPASAATGRAADLAAVNAGTGQASAGQSASPTASTQSGPISQVTAPVSDLTSTVQQALEAAPTAVLGVQPPTLPAPPIVVPPLPIPQPPLPPLPLP